MSGLPSRRKGAGGELDWCALLHGFGFEAKRGLIRDVEHNIPNVHFEVKRQERLCVPEWCRQAERDARPGESPVVAFRRSREPWRVIEPAEEWLWRMAVLL